MTSSTKQEGAPRKALLKTSTFQNCLNWLGITLMAAGAAMGTAAQTPGDRPLVSIVQPSPNAILGAGNVEVGVRFGAGAERSTFTAHINGADITSRFQYASNCGNGAACDMQAFVPESNLLNGANILTVDVVGPNDAIGTGRVKFWSSPPSVRSDSVSLMTPAVAVQSVYLPSDADANTLKNYQIVLGPGPEFPKRIYTAEHLNCSAGINSVQALVLQRQTLEVESTVGSGTGQACFGTAASLSTFLKGLPKGDLVIVNSFLGTMSKLDTTAMGGTNFVGTEITPSYYNAIGVAGAPAGSAFQSYQDNLSHIPQIGRSFLPALVGSLMLDSTQHYYFVPSKYPEFKVVPGTSARKGCASISYDGTTGSACTPSDAIGGFWIVAVDRRMGSVTDSYVLPTNSSNVQTAKKAINDMTYLLDVYYKKNDLLLITTFGAPFGPVAGVTEGLWSSINRIGGNGYDLAKLKNDDLSAYSLISSTDPDFVKAHYALESTTVSGETGQLHGVFGFDRSNRLVPKTGASEDEAKGQSALDVKWTQVGSQQPQDWPEWPTGQKAAYLDLTADTAHYPDVRYILGCNKHCLPVRGYYSDMIGSAGIKPGILNFPFSSLQYYPGAGYTKEDFDAVITQLKIEQGYENNIYQLYALFRAVTADSQTNLQLQLKSVAEKIDGSIGDSKAAAKVPAEQLALIGRGFKSFVGIPGIGPAAGGMGAIFGLASTLTAADTNGAPYTEYNYTLGELKNNQSRVGKNLASSTDALFAGIVDDWGKLSVIGAGYGDKKVPWYMCARCAGANVPAASLPAFALSAKQKFYLTLLPTVYSLDKFSAAPTNDPKLFKREIQIQGDRRCFVPYRTAPDEAFWNYPTVSNPSTWDIYIVTQTQTTKIPFSIYFSLSFPSSSLVDDLFGESEIKGEAPDYYLSGGAALNEDQLMENMTQRAAYLPGTRSSWCGYP